MIVLGIESSCDECAAAVVRDGTEVLSQTIASQIADHTPYMGVVPELASRLHTELIVPTVTDALAKANVSPAELDGVAVTNRPGLLGSLLVGLSFAKGFAATHSLPFITVDHILAHLYAPQMERPLSYPYLGVLVSGGHTVLAQVDGYDTVTVLGTTVDDAIGEAFDKIAKHYDFGYPGGKVIDDLARKGNPLAFLFPGTTLPNPLDLSYSGLKSAVIHQLDSFWDGKSEKSPENIAASFERQAVNMIIKRIRLALEETGLQRISAGGGVAANTYFREQLLAFEQGGYEVALPSLALCTDNAAMIAGLGYHYLADGITSPYSEGAQARVRAFKRNNS
ncbi:MAG TPA: tRNA (adenosine(37)-N6)-threonylcarbamoyltransferase complex transferase subunit TsaD [Sphaerochaeta sp.]|nr:tRNA (adenosine(37)-N6)-threonylcarbamoyltransferase complex transferase subunit TsaD [Sphaerochaeta sp.]